MSQHTPGPWVFMTDETFGGQIRTTDDFTLIATAADDQYGEQIAAAPTLHSLLCEWLDTTEHDNAPEDFELLVKRTRAALGFSEVQR